jgi:type IV secretory pathway VirB10-like protein
MSFHDNGQNKPISPNPETETPAEGLPDVAVAEDVKKKTIMLVVGVVLVLSFLGLRHCTKKPESVEATSSVELSDKPNYHTTVKNKPAMSVLMVDEPIEKTVTRSPKTNETLQRQIEEIRKFNKLRRTSSIEFKVDVDNRTPSDFESQRPIDPAVASLPLSSRQIDALKRSQGGSPNEHFQQQVAGEGVVHASATQMADLSDTLTQGTLISGVLQTAINSDLPGMIKANVSEDIYSANGQKLLVPKGSILVGQYNSGVVMGQKRALVMWSRLLRADGVSVMLGSPGTDSLGTAGLGADVIETHFWERFGQASLLSIIGTGIATAGVDQDAEYNSESAYRLMMASNFQSSASAALSGTLSRSPTLHIFQGTKINVFVNRDISFRDVNVAQGG